METIEIDGNTFQIGKLDAFSQLHVFRRVMPLLKPMAAAWKSGDSPDMLDIVMAVADDFAALPDEQLDYVVKKCMSVVKMQQGERFAPLMRADKLMFDNLDMAVLMRLSVAVIMENFQGFFANLPGVASSAGEVESAA